MPEETKNSVVSATDEDNATLLHQAMIKEDYSNVMPPENWTEC